MVTPSKIVRGPLHAIDQVRKRRYTGRLDTNGIGQGLTLDSLGRIASSDDYINLLDYTPVGYPTSDSTAFASAIADCASENKNLLVPFGPSGRYVIDSSITLQKLCGFTVFSHGPGGVTSSGYDTFRYGPIIMWGGSVGPGSGAMFVCQGTNSCRFQGITLQGNTSGTSGTANVIDTLVHYKEEAGFGTSYNVMDNCKFYLADKAVQFGVSSGDVNCDNHTFRNAFFQNISTAAVRVNNDQGLNYTFEGVSGFVNVPLCLDFIRGGALHVTGQTSVTNNSSAAGVFLKVTNAGSSVGPFRVNNVRTEGSKKTRAFVMTQAASSTVNFSNWYQTTGFTTTTDAMFEVHDRCLLIVENSRFTENPLLNTLHSGAKAVFSGCDYPSGTTRFEGQCLHASSVGNAWRSVHAGRDFGTRMTNEYGAGWPEPSVPAGKYYAWSTFR